MPYLKEFGLKSVGSGVDEVSEGPSLRGTGAMLSQGSLWTINTIFQVDKFIEWTEQGRNQEL